ncbi:MAG: esterase family protein [Verrucomicrobia bacterium]|nr:esterase family protein [Verrucomicrobiota bacterium]
MLRRPFLSVSLSLLLPVLAAPLVAADGPPASVPAADAAKKKAKAPPRPLAEKPSPAHTTDGVEFTIGPDYTWAPELKVRAGAPTGTIHDFTMNSEDSKIYPGIARGQTGVVPYKRRVTVYLPAGYQAGTPSPVIIGQDGNYRDFLPTVLDNMIHDKRLPAMIAVMINSGGGDSLGSQRGLEYDTVSGVYANFIETEVLPRIEKDYHVKFTKDPDARATLGGSSGAAAAFTMAWFRPDLYHRVLSYSGTYVNQQSPLNLSAPRDQWVYQPDSPRGAWEYHAKFIPESPRKPIKIWLHVSDEDNGYTRDEASLHNWVLANQRMATALKAKGYTYRYVFSKASGHTDGRVIRQTLPGALEWLWSDYKLTP